MFEKAIQTLFKSVREEGYMEKKTMPVRLKELAHTFYNTREASIQEWQRRRALLEEATDTRDRIFVSARKTFAKKGRSATIREICNEAGANVAAVNYHFGNKDKLLASVLEAFLLEVRSIYPMNWDTGEELTAEERLFIFVLAEMSGLLLSHGDEYLQLNKLLLDAFVNDFEEFEEAGNAHWVFLHDYVIPIIDGLTGNRWTLVQLEKLSAGFFAQMFFYAMHIEDLMMDREENELTLAEVAGIAQHITAFSIGGMKNYSEFMDAENDFPNLCSLEHCKRARRANRM